MLIPSEYDPLCLALKINYEYGWIFLYLYADDTKLLDEYGGELQLMLNIVNGGNLKLILATTTVKIWSKERMTKELMIFH